MLIQRVTRRTNSKSTHSLPLNAFIFLLNKVPYIKICFPKRSLSSFRALAKWWRATFFTRTVIRLCGRRGGTFWKKNDRREKRIFHEQEKGARWWRSEEIRTLHSLILPPQQPSWSRRHHTWTIDFHADEQMRCSGQFQWCQYDWQPRISCTFSDEKEKWVYDQVDRWHLFNILIVREWIITRL